MKLLLSVLLLVGVSHFAMAEEDMGPCHEDMQKLCKDVKQGEGRKMKCMKEHESELSQACKDHRTKMKDDRKGVRDACHDDMKTYCGDVKGGEGRKMKCMKEHKDQFSQACKDSMEKMKADRKADRK